MQAKESLQFIEQFTPNREYAPPSPEATQAQGYFVRICLGMLDLYPENIQQKQVLEASGFITALESSLTLQYSDGSYLHVVVFGHANEGGYIDLCIAVEEHDENEMPTSGYVYALNGEGLARTATRNTSDDIEEGDDPHFSLVGLYESLEEIRELESSSDDEVARYAREVREEIDRDVSMGLWERELGYDGQHPTLDEIEKLASVVALSSPRARKV